MTTTAAALSLVVIHFARLSQPVDAEALNIEVGTLTGVVTLEIGLDDSATIQYDPQRTTCERASRPLARWASACARTSARSNPNGVASLADSLKGWSIGRTG